MRKISIFSIILLSILFIQCGDKDKCAAEAWIGTYTLNSEKECTFDVENQGVLVFNDDIIIEAGATENAIIVDDDELTIIDCSVTDGITTWRLNGKSITSEIGICSATYSKN